MGLACSQARLLTLTARKADCEYGMSIDSMHKMALAREMSELSQDYYSKLQAKKISYYADGQYHKMNYQYLMGYGSNYTTLFNRDSNAMKTKSSMILTDYKGQVVLSNDYAQVLTSVLGPSAMDKNGRGCTFSSDQIPEILAHLTNFGTAEDFKNVIDEKGITSAYNANIHDTLYGNDTGEDRVIDNSATKEEKIKAIIDFYYPIFIAAANNGWTTEYNKDMALNDDYISDALVTGSFQLTSVNNVGDYDERGSLTYFITAGLVQARTHSDEREAITAWYEDEKARISEKESMIDLHISDLSMELESIKTEIQSIQSLIDDAVSSVFDWGGG